jgi:ribosomal protein L29
MTYSSPLTMDLKEFTDHQLEEKISDLQKKYFMSQNPQVRHQIANFLDFYKEEIVARRVAAQKKLEEKQNNLDSLINVS